MTKSGFLLDYELDNTSSSMLIISPNCCIATSLILISPLSCWM